MRIPSLKYSMQALFTVSTSILNIITLELHPLPLDTSPASPSFLPSRARTEGPRTRTHRLHTMPATLLPGPAVSSVAMRYLQHSHHRLGCHPALRRGCSFCKTPGLQPSLLPRENSGRKEAERRSHFQPRYWCPDFITRMLYRSQTVPKPTVGMNL